MADITLPDMAWKELGFRHHALVNKDGRVIAEIHGVYPPGCYRYNGEVYVSLDFAKQAVERKQRGGPSFDELREYFHG